MSFEPSAGPTIRRLKIHLGDDPVIGMKLQARAPARVASLNILALSVFWVSFRR